MAKTYHPPSFVEIIRADYFSTRLNAVVTVTFALFVAWALWQLVNWGVINATFSEENKDACGHGAGGACWAVIDARWRLVLFGLYPFEEQWRSAIACAAIVITGVLSCLPWFWSARRLSGLWISGFLVFYVLMRGGVFGLTPVFEQNWGGLSLTIFVFALSRCGAYLERRMAVAQR